MYYSDGTRGIERSGSNPNLDLLDSYEEVSGAEDQPGLEIYICSCMKASLDSRFDLICDNDYYQVSVLTLFERERLSPPP